MKKLLVIGDSISVHYGPFLEQCLRGKLQYARRTGQEEALRNLDVPRGANSGDSAGVVQRLQSMAQGGGADADVLLLNCGLHDVKTDPVTGAKQVSLEDYRGNLRRIVGLAREMKVALVWVRTTPCDGAIHNARVKEFHRFAVDVERYNAAADEVMAQTRTPSIDLFGFTKNLGGELYCDHVHFMEPVRQQQGAFIAGWVLGWLGE